jgi:hypothetical protein
MNVEAVVSVPVTFSTTAVAEAGVRADRSTVTWPRCPTLAPDRVSSTRTGDTGTK